MSTVSFETPARVGAQLQLVAPVKSGAAGPADVVTDRLVAGGVTGGGTGNSRAAAMLSLERMHQVSLVPVGKKPVLQGELAEELKRQVMQLAEHSGYRVISIALRPDRFDVLVELGGLHRRESVTREMRGLTSLRLIQAFPWIRVRLKSNRLWD